MDSSGRRFRVWRLVFHPRCERQEMGMGRKSRMLCVAGVGHSFLVLIQLHFYSCATLQYKNIVIQHGGGFGRCTSG